MHAEMRVIGLLEISSEKSCADFSKSEENRSLGTNLSQFVVVY